MDIALHIAKRYLFSKKSHNAINIISGISAVGVCVGTFAIICVLSVFNGFGAQVESLFSTFDPDLKIASVEGKSFVVGDKWNEVKKIKGVEYCTQVVEENALLRCGDKQETGVVKGVGEGFDKMVGLDKIIVAGNYTLSDNVFNYGVPGVGVSAELGCIPYGVQPLYIYAPKREGRVNLVNPENSFNTERVFTSAVFSVQQPEYDNKLVIVSIDLARKIFEYADGTVTSVEIGVKKGENVDDVKKQIETVLGDGFKVKDRYEQQEDYFKIMKVEKWITFLILAFILLIAIFNIIGSLSMLIIDKSDDIRTLRNMGATSGLIKRIFTIEGWMISLLGCVIGILLGALLCVLQENMGFITVPSGDGMTVMPYPVELQVSDILIVFATVALMGLVAAYYPASQIKEKK
ncbi:MAG: ABC transporter permease [Paludibacteraceae bacterium]|nr:ABC transporter permease [Paludibacteraceae bacterium]MBR6077652.1 ABC transporter permease [Paludibacteraceae bacterium]MBR6804113.1 ABC transporter permease [Paludibacteraceae bacterium]